MNTETLSINADHGDTIDAEGYIISPDGEVIGHVGYQGVVTVASDADADAVLEMRSEIEGRIAELAIRRKALVGNLDAQIARQRKRLAWWEWRFWSPLVGYARTRISDKRRTAQFSWGSVSFRKTPPHTTIIDEAAALAFVKAYAPELVVESVGVKAVVEASARADRQNGPGYSALRPLVVTSQPGESVTVSTGINQEPKP